MVKYLIMSHKHKFEYKKSENNYCVADDSFTCLKCDLCFCGCDTDIDFINWIPKDEKDFIMLIEEINLKSSCYLSDDEFMIKQIIE
jgi:hypothetical protein